MTFCETIEGVTRDLTNSLSTLWTPPGGGQGAVGIFCAEAATPRVEDPAPDRGAEGVTGASRPHRVKAHRRVKDGTAPEAGAKVSTLGGGKAKGDHHEHQWGMPDTMIRSMGAKDKKALLHQQTQQEAQSKKEEGNLGLIHGWMDRQQEMESQMAGVPANRRAKKVERMIEKTALVREALHRETAEKEKAAHAAAPAFIEFSALQNQAYKNVWNRTGVSPEEHSQVVRELQCRGRTEGEERQRLAVQASIMDKKLLKDGNYKNDFTVFRGGGEYGHGQQRKQVAQAEAEFEVHALNPYSNRLATIGGLEIFR